MPMPMTLLKPPDVTIHEAGMLTATLGHAELEQAAACVVRYHQASGLEEWSPIPALAFLDFCATDKKTREWSRNPFWRPDFMGLADKGWVDGWDFDSPTREEREAAIGKVTPKFIAAVSNPRIGPPPHVSLGEIEAIPPKGGTR